MEKVLEEISFNAPDMTEKSWPIDATYVREKLIGIVQNQDLSRYIL
jgi:ATP-dependent HslUV protease ATP-binding subunit HslU